MSLEAELTFQAFENDTKLPRCDNKEIHTGERKKKDILVSNKNSNKVKNNTKWIVICKKNSRT